jgi:four helix bundle protein
MKAELPLRGRLEAGGGRREAVDRRKALSGSQWNSRIFRAITKIEGDTVVDSKNEGLEKSQRAPVRRFEDLEVWKESMQLAVRVYHVMNQSGDFGLRDQMQRAAVSVPSNIAEGYERESNKEFVRVLNYSRGSSEELRTQVYLAAKLGVIDPETSKELIERSRKVSAMLHKYVEVRKRDF